MPEFTPEGPGFRRNRPATEAQIRGGISTLKDLLDQWTDDWDTMDTAQKLSLVKQTNVILLKAVIWIAEKILRRLDRR